jgi:hypothetical protein
MKNFWPFGLQEETDERRLPPLSVLLTRVVIVALAAGLAGAFVLFSKHLLVVL